MAGLGRYSIEPELGGSFFVRHECKALCKSYANEHFFKHDLQKHDWKILYQSLKDVMDTMYQIYKGHYFVKNRAYQNEVLSRLSNDFNSIKTMNPVEIGVSLKYMIDVLPLFARTNQSKYDTSIKENVQTISEYYKRYLEKYENFNNSFLTA